MGFIRLTRALIRSHPRASVSSVTKSLVIQLSPLRLLSLTDSTNRFNKGKRKSRHGFYTGRETIPDLDRTNTTSAVSLAAFIGWNLNLVIRFLITFSPVKV